MISSKKHTHTGENIADSSSIPNVVIAEKLILCSPCNLTNEGIYIEYVCERLFTGPFCYDKTNILVNEYSGTLRGISIKDGNIDHSYFYQPKVFSFFTPKNIITN